MTKPEVHVRSVRRRRSDPPVPPAPEPPNIRNWLIYTGITVLIAALMLDGFLRHRPQHPPLPRVAYAAEVRSAVTEVGDSLQVVVSWDLTLADSGGRPDSVQVKVMPSGRGGINSSQSGKQLSDTDIAAVITYTKNNWSNKTGQTVQPAEVLAQRKQ